MNRHGGNPSTGGISPADVRLPGGPVWPAFYAACTNEVEPDGELCPGLLFVEVNQQQGRCGECGAWSGRFAPDVEAAPKCGRIGLHNGCSLRDGGFANHAHFGSQPEVTM